MSRLPQFDRHGVRLLFGQNTYNSKRDCKMTTLTNQIRLQIAEKSAGSLNFLALLRWALVIIFLWFGGMKFTAYEAAGIAPFIEHSPILSWLLALFGVQGASYVIGVMELSTATALILGAFQPIFPHWERRCPLRPILSR